MAFQLPSSTGKGTNVKTFSLPSGFVKKEENIKKQPTQEISSGGRFVIPLGEGLPNVTEVLPGPRISTLEALQRGEQVVVKPTAPEIPEQTLRTQALEMPKRLKEAVDKQKGLSRFIETPEATARTIKDIATSLTVKYPIRAITSFVVEATAAAKEIWTGKEVEKVFQPRGLQAELIGEEPIVAPSVVGIKLFEDTSKFLQEKGLSKTSANAGAGVFTPLLLAGINVMDALPFYGGGAKNAIRDITKTTDRNAMDRILRDLNVADDIRPAAVEKFINIHTEEEVLKGLEQLDSLQRSTKLAKTESFQKQFSLPSKNVKEPVKINPSELSNKAINSLENKPIGEKPNGLTRAIEEIKQGNLPPVKVRTLEDGSTFIEDGRHHLEAARKLGIQEYPIEDVTGKYIKKTKEEIMPWDIKQKKEVKLNQDQLLKQAVRRTTQWKKEGTVQDILGNGVLMRKNNNGAIAKNAEEKVRLIKNGYKVVAPIDEIAQSKGWIGNTGDFLSDFMIRKSEKQLLAEQNKLEKKIAKEQLKQVRKERNIIRVSAPTKRLEMKVAERRVKVAERQGERVVKQVKRNEMIVAQRREEVARRVTRHQVTERLKTLYDKKIAGIKTDKEILARRREFVRTAQRQFGLSDYDIKKITRKDIRLMSNIEFKKFIDDVRIRADKLSERKQAINEYTQTLRDNDFKRHENLIQALDYPKSLSEMTTEQIRSLDNVFQQYKYGDEFLPVKMQKTLRNTPLKGVRTTREVLEVLANQKGMTVEEVSKIKINEMFYGMGDRILARQNPFFERVVTMKNRAMLEADSFIIEATDKVDSMLLLARSSRNQSLLDKLIPSDKKVIDWLESSTEKRLNLSKEMTVEEIRASEYMDSIFRKYYDYLVQKNAEKKFSRFENVYYPHVRRPFLEAFKDDGLLKAIQEQKDKHNIDEMVAGILNQQTGDILPYEKWVGFTKFRSDKLIPTKNAAKAFEAYVTALERARQLDALIPEVMAYVYALSPRKMTQGGVEIDTKLKRFIKEWINANKGRTPKGFFEPGGKLDWAIRGSVSLTRILDLAVNVAAQVSAPIGEQAMNFAMLGAKEYKTALLRLNTAQGKEILSNYENFLGRSLFKDISRAANTAGDKLMSGIFAGFNIGARKGNEIFLLGKMTESEFKTGKISTERLAELKLEMSKYRSVKGLESIMGRTTEGNAFLQYKSWAVNPATATITNIQDILKIIKDKGVRQALKSKEGKELFYSIGIGAIIATTLYGYFNELEKKKRNFSEDLVYKAMRESMTIFGALDPNTWTQIRIVSFYNDLAKNMKDIEKLAKQLTPRAVKQFIPPIKKKETGPIF